MSLILSRVVQLHKERVSELASTDQCAIKRVHDFHDVRASRDLFLFAFDDLLEDALEGIRKWFVYVGKSAITEVFDEF